LLSGNEEGFWGKQWDNHGTCSQQKFNVLSYFKLALDNKDRVDILNELVLRNINPDPTKLYPIVWFENAIMLVTKKIPELRCIVRRGRGRVRVVYLFEVGMCLDAAGSNFIDCVPPTQAPVNPHVTDCKGQNVRLLPL
jgi:ribonuclease I